MEGMCKNIILIGMPDSEKITIGKILSKKLGFKFVDADQCIQDKKETANKLSKAKNSIISTEVEVLKNYSNMKELRENSLIVFIDKKEHETAANTTVLGNEVNKFHKHFIEKYEACKRCCDLHLVNDNNIDEIVHYISHIYS